MMIVVYALGRVYRRYEDRICWDQVCGICDKNSEIAQSEAEKKKTKYLNISELRGSDADYIVIFSTEMFSDIYRSLIHEYGIDKSRVIPYSIFFDMTYTDRNFIKNYCNAMDIYNLLYCSDRPFNELFFQKGELSEHCEELQVDIYPNVLIECTYDLACILSDHEKILKAIESEKIKSRTVILSFQSSMDQLFAARKILTEYKASYMAEEVVSVYGITVILHKRGLNEKKSEIYVVCDHEYFPKDSEGYIPICVGGFKKKGYLSEQAGQSIAHLNDKLNESTAFFWIWKNSDSDIVGVNHYRRYFYSSNYMALNKTLEKYDILYYLNSYDLIISEVQYCLCDSILDYLKSTVQIEACESGMRLIEQELRAYQPEYVTAFWDMMNGNLMFPCNLLITPKEIFDLYCEWLFSFLIPAAEKIDISSFDPYSKRIMAFLSERMLTVWLMKQDLKIKELPFYKIV